MGNIKKLCQLLMKEENIPLNRMRAYLRESGYEIYDVIRRKDSLHAGAPKKHSDAKLNEISKLRMEGKSLSEISKIMRIPVGSVPYLLKRGETLENKSKPFKEFYIENTEEINK